MQDAAPPQPSDRDSDAYLRLDRYDVAAGGWRGMLVRARNGLIWAVEVSFWGQSAGRFVWCVHLCLFLAVLAVGPWSVSMALSPPPFCLLLDFLWWVWKVILEEWLDQSSIDV